MKKYWNNYWGKKNDYEKQAVINNLKIVGIFSIFIFMIVGVIIITDEGEPTSCIIKEAHVSSYKVWVENHSESELETYVDAEGDLQTEFVTHYWTEETNSTKSYDASFDCLKDSKISTKVANNPIKPMRPTNHSFDNLTLEHELQVTYFVQTEGGRVSKLEYSGFQLGTSFKDSVKVGLKLLQKNSID